MPKEQKLSKLDKVVASIVGDQEFAWGNGVKAALVRKAYQRGIRNGRRQENNRWLGVRMRSGPL